MGRRQRERHNRVEEIVDAAEQIMFAKGYEKTTLVEIAKKAEFSRPTLYKYFHSKEDIFLAIHMRGLHIRWEMMKTTMDAAPTAPEKLFGFADAYFKFATRYPEYMRLQLYWDSFGIDIDKIREDLFNEYAKWNKVQRAEIYEIFNDIIKDQGIDDFNIQWALGHWFFSLRTLANQAIHPIDTLRLYNDPGFYYQYVHSFIRSLTTLGSYNPY
jgi:AcrR family transcriptional regulator